LSKGVAAAVAAAGGYAVLYRLGQTWGSTALERRQALTGDELLPDARAFMTHAITIAAPAHDVWSWLMQMGWGRVGWYTYRWVDRLLFPANGPSADRLLSDHQQLAGWRWTGSGAGTCTTQPRADSARPAQPDAPGAGLVRARLPGHDRPGGLRHGPQPPAGTAAPDGSPGPAHRPRALATGSEWLSAMKAMRRLVQPRRHSAPLSAPCTVATTAAWPSTNGVHLVAAGTRPGRWLLMSVVTEHLEQQGSAFELLPHRQAYTSTDEARALGIDAGEVLKTLAIRTGSGYVLAVIPASRRLDLRLVRDALGDHQARLASEEELVRDFAGYQLGALPPLGALLGCEVLIDPEVPEHDLVVFAAGTQTESVRMRTRELFASEQVTTVPLVKQADWGSDDLIGRRRAAQQDLADGGHPAS
jgi:prolyl-tRNA editing enzyme YbaK/EbsC (Cys-tRNA(Pro) deacylase)